MRIFEKITDMFESLAKKAGLDDHVAEAPSKEQDNQTPSFKRIGEGPPLKAKRVGSGKSMFSGKIREVNPGNDLDMN